MTEAIPTLPPPTVSTEPATPPVENAIPWAVVLLCFALGFGLFIYLALIATRAGTTGA